MWVDIIVANNTNPEKHFHILQKHIIRIQQTILPRIKEEI